jgi:hypothetical protein
VLGVGGDQAGSVSSCGAGWEPTGGWAKAAGKNSAITLKIALCFCATVFAHEMAPKAMVLRGGIEV